MGEPNNPCFKPNSPYIKWTSSTTSTTTDAPSDDYFMLPVSGAICPSIVFDSGTNAWEYPQIPLTEKNIFTCISEQYDPNPCVIEIDKYIRVADINIDIDRCKRYKLVLSETPISTSTSTTTSSPFTCFQMRYGYGVTNWQTYGGSYAIGTVTASYGGSVWGTNQYGYTDDSRFNTAVIHAGLLSPGQTGQIKITFLGSKNNFPSSTSNGITSSPWSGSWCAVSLSIP
jgi:hypothetical protein